MKIGFAGNGHLMKHSKSAAFKKGFTTIGYTPAKTGDLLDDFSQCDIVYICPDRPSNTSPREMVDLVLPHLREDAVLVILCQVEPGFTDTIDWPKGQLYYQVETLRMRDAEERALNPDRIIIGSAAKGINISFWGYISCFNCPVIIMSFKEAELAKIYINVYLAAQVCVTNILSDVAKKLDADWNNITPALTSDKRIGTEAYLKPGGYCGKHLERDLMAMNNYQNSGVDVSVIQSLLRYSETLGSIVKQ